VASKYWIKLYHEILHDPKMGRLPDRTWRRAIEIFLIAGELGDDGHLPDVADMAWTLRVPEETILEDLRILAEAEIVEEIETGWLVTHFAARQAPSPGAERIQRYRDRKRKQQYDGNNGVTVSGDGCNESLQDRYDDGNDSLVEPEPEPDTDTEADAEAEPERAGAADPDAAFLFGLIDRAGIIISSTMQSERWLDLLELTRDHDLLREAFEAAAGQPGQKGANYIRAILERCLAEGRRPGERPKGKGPPRRETTRDHNESVLERYLKGANGNTGGGGEGVRVVDGQLANAAGARRGAKAIRAGPS